MSTKNRPPITHGARWLAVRLEQNRIEPRIRRLIARLQRELTATPFETLKALIIGRLARRELLMQQREAHLLADVNGEGGRWLVALWNAQRRDTELLALLDKLPDRAERLIPIERVPVLPPARANGAAAPPTSAATAVEAETSTHAHDAAALPACSEEPR